MDIVSRNGKNPDQFVYLDLGLGWILTKCPEDRPHLSTGAASIGIAEPTEGVLVDPWVFGMVIITDDMMVVTFLSVLY